MNATSQYAGVTPVVTELTVVPVAGHDSMLMNLSGAHCPARMALTSHGIS